MTDDHLHGYAIRPATFDDLPAVAAVNIAAEIAAYGEQVTSPDRLRNEWQTPGSDITRDSWLGIAPDGRIAGVADIYTQDGTHLFIEAAVHPDDCGRGLGTALLTRAEARGHELAERAPAEARVSLGCAAAAVNIAARELLEAQGYAWVRSSWQMRIDLAAPPPEPTWPAGIALRTFVPGQDDRRVFAAVEEAFSDHWGHTPGNFEFWHHLLVGDPDYDPALIFIAEARDGAVAGIARCSERVADGRVSHLAVRQPWRRQGLGYALLLHAFGAFYRRGQRRITLGVDSQNLSGATRLYERAGMRVVKQFDRYEKEVRPGVESAVRDVHS